MLKLDERFRGTMNQIGFVDREKELDLFGTWVEAYIPSDVNVAPIHMDLAVLLNEKCGRPESPFKVSSGFRTCYRNTMAGGANQSAHLIGFGADLVGSRAALKMLYEELHEKEVRGLILMDDYLHVDFLPRIYRVDKRTIQ